MSEERKFTQAELSRYTGRDGMPAYVAYQGKVYDVTRSLRWRNGQHMNRHNAGADLTAELAKAPHSASRLRRFPVVGILVEGEKTS